MANGKGRPIYNRGPSDIEDPQPIQTGGPPQPVEDKPVAIALHDLIQKVANLQLEIVELTRRVERLEEKE